MKVWYICILSLCANCRASARMEYFRGLKSTKIVG